MRQRLFRALALAACVIAPACLSKSGVSASTIQDPAVYGNAVWGNFVGNHTVGGSSRAKVALRGKAPFAACFDKLQIYLMAARNNTGYSKGDGGAIRATIQTLNSSDFPSGNIVGGPSTTYRPKLANGYLSTGETATNTLFPELTFSTPACLSAGEKFAVVFENLSPDPVDNYLGVQTLGVAMPRNSPAVDPIWAPLMQPSGGSWFVRVWSNESHVPIIRLCRSSDGACILQTYSQNAGARLVGGGAAARQLMTPATNLTVRSCKLTLARASSAATRVRIGIATLAGAYLNGGAAYQDVDISALPVVGDGLQASQVTATFPAPVSLTAGVQQSLLITSPTSGGVWVAPIQDGAYYFKSASGFGGTEDWVQYNDGSSWSDWNTKLADLQFYCQ